MEREIRFSLHQLATLRSTDTIVAKHPFIHQDRILDYHVLLYVEKGRIYVWEENERLEIGENSIGFLKAGLHHWGTEEIAAGTTWTYLHFYLPSPPAEAEDLYRYSRFVCNEEFMPADYHYQVLLPKQLHLGAANSILPMVSDIVSTYRSNQPERAALCSCKLQMLLYALAQQQQQESHPSPASGIVEKIIRLLEQHKKEAVSSAEIAAALDMNYQYLCALFKKHTGVSILHYHTRLRIQESARLLREGSVNVSQAAQQTGYLDPLYFSTVFKRVMGIPPKDYRNHTGS